MGIAFLHGNGGRGGSAPVNYKVVSGTTQPANPTENMIWVNMTTTVNEVVFSATRPENPIHGTVWIATGNYSTVAFNALKKDTIMVYPVKVHRYIMNGNVSNWDEKEAKIYQNGEWRDFLSGDFLYNQGDECVGISGGWQTFGYYTVAADYGGVAGNPSILSGTDSMVITLPSDGGVAVTKNKIDLTNYKTLTFRGDIAQVGTSSLGVLDSTAGTWLPTPVASVALSGVGTSVEYTLDVSSLNGSYYVGLIMKDANNISMHQMFLGK